MTDDLDQLITQYREQGPRRFAAWNADVFEAFLKGPVANLSRQLKWTDRESHDSVIVPNYLRLIYEGIGAGWLSTPDRSVPAATFLDHCLQTLVPYGIGRIAQSRRSRVLQQVWNLGEGLAREPQWLNQYAITRTTWSTSLEHLEKHLVEILAPVLSPAKPSDWQGKYELRILNLREHSDTFVPDQMYLAAPALLCISDRTDPSRRLAVLLQKQGQSEVLGAVGRLPEYTEEFDRPIVETHPDQVTINSHRIDTPLLNSARQSLCVRSGFVTVTAEDSQRLWLVDVP
ncbi:MAG: hypothetical protein R3C59_14140 [Planctomycetaceae bacterium]